MPRISAVICTHNGALLLGYALQSLAAQSLPHGEYEVIVVDNASSDATPAVVRETMRSEDNVRYVREEQLGLSYARNRAAAEAESPYIAYLDDDARADSGWLDSILTAFESQVPAPACVGGMVRLDWGGPAPSWLPNKYWSLYSGLDLGATGHFLKEREYLIGANIAFRRDALLEAGGFDTKLGRKGRTLLSGEEAALLQRFRKQGLPLYYEPNAAVSHFVHERRRKRSWLLNRMFWDGASQPLLDYGSLQPKRFYAGQAYRDLRRMARFGWDYVRAVAGFDSARCVDAGLTLIQRAGRLKTNLKLATVGDR